MSCPRHGPIWESKYSENPQYLIASNRQVPGHCICLSTGFLDHVLESREQGKVSMSGGNAFDALEMADKLLRTRPFRGARK
jgi:hypothetical protein